MRKLPKMFGANTSTSNQPSAPLASHPAFVWIIIAWTTILFGAAAYVVASAWSSSPNLPFILAFVAAVLGAIGGFILARSVGAKLPMRTKSKRSREAEEPEVDVVTGRRAASIISTQDLGSDSLDAPLELAESDIEVGDEEWPTEPLTQDARVAEKAAAFEHFEESPAEFSEEVSEEPLELTEPAVEELIENTEEQAEKPSTYYEDPFADDSFDEAPSPNDRHRRAALGRHKFMADEPLPLDAFANFEEEPVAEPATPIDLDRLTNKAADTAGDLDGDFPLELDGSYADIGPSGDESASLLSCATPAAVPAGKKAVDLDSTAPHEADAPLLEQTREAEIIELKERDLKDLSLVQMVERFAVGLDDHRVARVNDPASRRVRPSDPRIAQAIRDLPIAELKPSGDPETRAEAEQTEAALREALEKLQRMSDPS
ncbi:MAG: hypothetical protein ABJ242_02890 [Marinomonas sp.]